MGANVGIGDGERTRVAVGTRPMFPVGERVGVATGVGDGPVQATSKAIHKISTIPVARRGSRINTFAYQPLSVY